MLKLKCKKECINKINYEKDKHFGECLLLKNDEKSIQLEIMKNGSVAAKFAIYQDFLNFVNTNDKVYQNKKQTHSDKAHSVKIIGKLIINLY